MPRPPRGQLGEEHKLQSVLLALGWREALKNNTKATYQQRVAAIFKSRYHLDMARLRMTA